VVSAPVKAPADTLTFHAIWEVWKITVESELAPRTVHETKGILKQLEAFLGHNDAAQVTKADLIRWRTALKADGKSNLTWNNRLSQIGQVFKRAAADDLIPTDPTVGLRLDKGKSNPWKPYSDEDTVAILQAARKETSPSLRWAHWVMALSGMRVGEVLQLTGGDIEQDLKSGVWFMAVKHDPENGKASKNSLPRNVPMHPSLIEEGFLAYALGIKDKAGDVTLFPDKKPDKYGRLGGRAWNLVGTWVREVVGLKDPKKAPNHSWRHRMEDELRDADVYEADRDAIIGHARKTVGAKYGERGEPLARLHRGLSKVKLPPGL
jgi:integrase